MIAAIIFALSLIGIIALFAIKAIEMRRDERFFPALRESADQRALRLKSALFDSRRIAAQLPPFTLYVARVALHEAALGLAKAGRMLEREAHRLADYASHKRGFERRETKSQFLKDVTEHKNGNGTVEESENI